MTMITDRPAAPTDWEFLYGLHRATMRAYVAATFGAWDETWQRADFRQHIPLAEMRILQWEGCDVGVVWLQNRAEEIFIALLEVDPRYQRRGIGSTVLRRMQTQAAQARKIVALRVLKVNSQAQALYRRLGFSISGETPTHWVMAWDPLAEAHP